jgi:N-acyl homoserine lactone hydrolase
MVQDMRLYVLDVGSLVLHSACAMAARSIEGDYRIPVPAFVVTHPLGNVLYDTGMDPATINNPAAVWGELLHQLSPNMEPHNHIVQQLAVVGLRPGDISYVVLSHLHLDHAGGICLFPNAEFILQRAELETSVQESAGLFFPEAYRAARLDGTLADCVRSVRLVDGDIDLFEDDRVLVISTPGHTPGHQSLLVRLIRTGDVLLAGDACNEKVQMDDSVIPDGTWRTEPCRRSIGRLRELRERVALTIYGHDPDLWPTLKHAPEYYD